ncbi:hypothetical protein EYY83_18125 [Hafnia alvei]|uniref:sce7725 family protein n=1 Tax=Hafnia alvei TaxID=569 RepID=UPI00061CEA07|nr:sce7725 family protein [Hafnia alvei]KKF38414.1 hypothetical protein PU01_23490 [Hafnia alvei]MBW3477071.1 sce7725 family protein [Hafnia alvei]TBM11504.1 hypothetical protein EYY83_18125 [Hafnia alvei]
MYSPYFYARNTELLCLRDIVNKQVNTSGLMPILEPVNADIASLVTCLNAWNSDLIVILNPYQNDYSLYENVTNLNNQLSNIFSTKPNLIMGCLVSSRIDFQSINTWVSGVTSSRIALLYDNPALSDAEIQSLANNPAIHYHVILNGRMLPNQLALLPMNKVIVINDNFIKLARNADYSGVEFFTNSHSFVGVNYLGFGDYTITGSVLDLSGGPASAVASHLIFKDIQSNHIWIRHFVSTNTQRNSSSIANKFLDVSDQITNFVPQNVNQYGNNIGLDYYYNCTRSRHSPGLGKNKQYQISHHICFMLDVVNRRI